MGTKQKPYGVVAIMIYAAIIGTIQLVAGLAMIMGSATPESAGMMFALYSAILLVFGVLDWCAFFGLAILAEWGRKLMLWLSLVAIPVGVLAIFPLFPGAEITAGNTVYQLFTIGISGTIIHYLARPSLWELFSRRVVH